LRKQRVIRHHPIAATSPGPACRPDCPCIRRQLDLSARQGL